MPTAGVEQQQTFQFHKGAIKTQLLFTGSFTASQFQFHKGTIKTSIGIVYRYSVSDLFQFHKGTIKTSDWFKR